VAEIVPLSNLDGQARVRPRPGTARASRRLGATAVQVSDDRAAHLNLMRGVFTRAAGGLSVLLGDQLLPVDPVLLRTRPGLTEYLECPVIVGIRPEDMEDANLAWSRSAAVLRAQAHRTEAVGPDLLVHVRVPPDPRTELMARFNPRSPVRAGDQVHIAVDTARLHVFDLNTGRAVW
jgi:multiple sugar transport system ATP-binding protein